jgi:hypothetical protein
MRAVLLAGVCLAVVTEGQVRPDFSGRWMPVSPPEIAGDARQAVTITQTATTLTMSHPSEGGSHSITYNLDGSERRTTLDVHGRIDIVASAKWEGARLVLREVRSGTHDEKSTDVRYVMWLDDQGQLVFDLTEPAPDGKPRTTKAIFRRMVP